MTSSWPNHAYGCNGILVEVEVALTPAVAWQHTITAFDRYADTLQFSLDAGAAALHGELDLFQCSTVERRITPSTSGLRGLFGHGQQPDADLVFAQVAPADLPAFTTLAASQGGRVLVHGTEAELLARGPAVSHRMCLQPHHAGGTQDRPPHHLPAAGLPRAAGPGAGGRADGPLGDEVLMHHEFSRAGGALVAFALPLVNYFDEAQLRTLISGFEADGCQVYDPHTWVLEDGGMKQVDEAPVGLQAPGRPAGPDEPRQAAGVG